MPRWQRVYLSACAGIIAYTLGYTVTDYARLPHLYYVQLERRWVFADRLTGLPSGYIGLWLWGAVAGTAAAAVAWLVSGRLSRPLGRRGLGLGLAWTLTSFLLCLGYFTWNNWP